jgi:radical SAM superfamily enzyme
MVVHRLTGETYRAITVAPEWSINKMAVHNAIWQELELRDTWQGRFYPKDRTQELEPSSFPSAEGAPF